MVKIILDFINLFKILVKILYLLKKKKKKKKYHEYTVIRFTEL